MTRYMRSGESVEPHDPLEASSIEIERTHRIETITDEDRLEAVRENVEKIYRAAESRPIEDDEQVVQAMNLLWSPQSPEECYYFSIAPVAARIDGLEWQSAYRVDFSDTVAVGSDDFVEVASEFNIPNSSRYDLVPKFITHAYKRMRQLAERNSGYTYIHQYELEGTGKTPYLSQRGYDSSMKYVGRLPGITPPDSDAPAWELTE